jgi:tetratricopeptide (TPR) repeat protein
MSKCFVSFSSRDGEFAGKLMASLRLQEIDVWDYSNPAEDIRLGDPVQTDLCRRIDGSKWFIGIITPSSSDPHRGKYCIFELKYANSNGMRIFPIRLAQYSSFDPDPELPFLKDTKYLTFDDENYEISLAHLCEDMGAPYVPPFLGDPRIIFAARFDKEIRGLALSREHSIKLRLIIDEFTREYAAGRWLKARKAIDFFLASFERAVEGIVPYYPTLLLALCQMHMNKLDDAEETLNLLLNHKLADENLWAAIGQIDFMRGDYEKALAKFKIAKEKCPTGKDWEARYNILAASVELGRTEEATAAFEEFDLSARPLDDQVKVASLQARLFAQRGQWQSVITMLRDIFDRKVGDAVTAIALADAYERRFDASNAVAVLASEADRLDDANLYHHLATLHVRLGDSVRALQIYELKLLENSSRPRQMLTDYALILQSIGRFREAQEVYRRAVALPSPAIESEHYFRGLAFYLLGRHAEAQLEYADSRRYAQYYDEFLAA